MSTKKQFKETKFGSFLKKAGAVLPEILNVGGKVITGNFSGAVKEVGEILTKKAIDNKEVLNLLNEFKLAEMDFEKEVYALEIQDRESARNREIEMAKTGKTDWLMYATGLIGLAAFCVIIYAVIWVQSFQDNKLFFL